MSYHLEIARNTLEIELAQAFRTNIFRNGRQFTDADEFDDNCLHFLIFDLSHSNKLVCVFRVMIISSFTQIKKCYSYQFYKLTNLKNVKQPMLELGRFCIDPTYKDPKIILMAWGALRKLVEKNDIKLLFGCSSFPGTSVEKYLDCFKFLSLNHLAPRKLGPYVKAPNVFKFNNLLNLNSFCSVKAKKTLPPLLASYLKLGGWVSNHAVIDKDLGTLHVFTGLQVDMIPPKRKLFLQSL
tara:strand:+ start:88 stop:804 length:717 start_codon:yes stop_codon:yes gene_type:complete